MKAAIIDASVAVKWFVAEDDSDEAGELLAGLNTLHAPDLLRTEVANALWINCRRNIIDIEQATASLAGLERSITRWHDSAPHIGDAFDLAIRLAHPVYDLVYLALAQRRGIPLITADRRLVDRLADTEFATLVVRFADWRKAGVR